MVELKARFDEAANIAFAEQLESVGIHVSYGVVGLKTHCQSAPGGAPGLRRTAPLRAPRAPATITPSTARLYADLGLFTTDPLIAQDANELFNYLTTGYGPGRAYRKILPAPARLKRAMLDRIEREASPRRPTGLIQFKMNALEDADITRALYRASQAGVRIDLIVRDTCRLRPGLPGFRKRSAWSASSAASSSTRASTTSATAGAEEYFIGSADCMKRNLESRVEVLVPVEDSTCRQRLRAVLDLQLTPNRNAWDMQSDGSYVRAEVDRDDRGCQSALMDWLLVDHPAPRRRRLSSRLARRSAAARLI